MKKLMTLSASAIAILSLTGERANATKSECLHKLPSGVIYQLKESVTYPFAYKGVKYKLLSPEWKIVEEELFGRGKLETYDLSHISLIKEKEGGKCTYSIPLKSKYFGKAFTIKFKEEHVAKKEEHVVKESAPQS